MREEETESESEEDYSSDSYYYNGSYWDPSWYFRRDFRFSQVKKRYAIAEGRGATGSMRSRTRSLQSSGNFPSLDLPVS